MNQKIVCQVIGALVIAGFAATAHAQGKASIDVSGLAKSSNSLKASDVSSSVGLSGATNSVPGEPGRIVAIPEAGTALLTLGGASVLGLVLARRRK